MGERPEVAAVVLRATGPEYGLQGSPWTVANFCCLSNNILGLLLFYPFQEFCIFFFCINFSLLERKRKKERNKERKEGRKEGGREGGREGVKKKERKKRKNY